MRLFISIINFLTVTFACTVLLFLSVGVVVAMCGINITNLMLILTYIGVAIIILSIDTHLIKNGHVTRVYFDENPGIRRMSESEGKLLLPLVNDICDKYNIRRPKVYIQESPVINASVVGNDTLIMNRGLLQFATVGELHAIIAHEIGHIKHNDNIYYQFNYVLHIMTSCIYSFIFFPFANRDEGPSVLIALFLMPLYFYSLLLLILSRIVGLLVSLVERLTSPYAEYRADSYAVNAGLGNQLISFGEKLMEISPEEQRNYRFFSTHPTWKRRIEAAKRRYFSESVASYRD